MPLSEKEMLWGIERTEKSILFKLAILDSFLAKFREEMKRNALIEKKNSVVLIFAFILDDWLAGKNNQY